MTSRQAANQALCQACGMCCDGSFFAKVPLGVGEKLPFAEGHALVQPCVALKALEPAGRTCSCYAARPVACRKYECLLSLALTDDEVQLPEALELVAEARRRIAAVEQALPARGPKERRSTMQRADRDRDDLSAEAKLAFGRAKAWLKRHFVGHGR